MDLSVLYIILIALAVFALVVTVNATATRRRMMKRRMADFKAEQHVMGKDSVHLRKGRSADAEKILHEKLSANERMAKALETAKEEFEIFGLGKNPAMVLLIWAFAIVLTPIITALIMPNILAEAALTILVAYAPVIVIKIKKKQRNNKITKQLENAISIIVNAIRAGYSFQSALHSVGLEMDPPISEEFERVFKETSYGKDMSVALQNMATRTDSEDITLLEIAYSVNATVGGDMCQILRTISNTIGLRHRLNEEIKAKTSSGRLSGLMVGVLPVALMIVINFVDPGYMDFFFVTELGRKILIGTICLELLGLYLINKIVTIKY